MASLWFEKAVRTPGSVCSSHHRARECPSQHLCVHGEMVVFPIMILILQEKMGSKLDSIT